MKDGKPAAPILFCALVSHASKPGTSSGRTRAGARSITPPSHWWFTFLYQL